MSLPTQLQGIVDDLARRLENNEYSSHAHDVFSAIKDCIETSRPIPTDLQDQYVRIIASGQQQDRYGK